MHDTGRMNARPRLLTLALALASLVAACAPAGGEVTPPAATDGSVAQPSSSASEPAATDLPATDLPATDPPAGAPDTPAPTTPTIPTEPTVAPLQEPWRTAELVDVRSGETLTINELSGQLVIIEPMAIWCSSCRFQQNEARKALESLGREDIVFISLDVDPNESEPALARYADELGFSWQFVVATRELSRSLADTFGVQVLSPPSTPKIVVAPDGTAEVSFGIKRADQLEGEFSALLP